MRSLFPRNEGSALADEGTLNGQRIPAGTDSTHRVWSDYVVPHNRTQVKIR